MKKIAILGGGLTGLTLANLLNNKYEVTVFEKEKVPGGLCRSFNFKGFTFDIGGHIIYSRDREVLNFIIKFVGRNNLFKRTCRDSILYKDRLIDYPFETDLAKLGKVEAYECLKDFLNRRQEKTINFNQWIYNNFGKALAEKYLLPYNKKIWKINPALLDIDWVARVPVPTTDEIIKSCLGIKFAKRIERKKFFYPKKGGIQFLSYKLADKLGKSLRFNSEIVRIKKNKDSWMVETKEGVHYFDDIISTIPIFSLFKLLDKRVPVNVISHLKKLRYNSIMIVCLGINRGQISSNTAIYIPDNQFYPNRICFMNNFSDNNAPKGNNSIIGEITYRPNSKLAKKRDSEILENVLVGLKKRKIINDEKIIVKKIIRFPYAYVVYDRNYNKNIRVIYSWLGKEKINNVGRFAEFQYLNMDGCIRHAVDFVNNYKL